MVLKCEHSVLKAETLYFFPFKSHCCLFQHLGYNRFSMKSLVCDLIVVKHLQSHHAFSFNNHFDFCSIFFFFFLKRLTFTHFSYSTYSNTCSLLVSILNRSHCLPLTSNINELLDVKLLMLTSLTAENNMWLAWIVTCPLIECLCGWQAARQRSPLIGRFSNK